MYSDDDGGAASAVAPVASVRTPSVVAAAKLLTPKGRREQGLFLAEGPQAVREALRAGVVTKIFVSATGYDRCRDEVLLALDAGVTMIECDEPALSKVTGSMTPQGIAATCTFPAWDVGLERDVTTLVICLDRVADPGNLGTIIRSADAAGADAVVLSAGCADPFNEKSVRSTTGSIFHIPVVIDADLADWASQAKSQGIQVLVADADGSLLTEPAVRAVLPAPTMWIFGSEAHGVDPLLLQAATAHVAIPHYGAAESLNVASAAAVCTFASAMAQHD